VTEEARKTLTLAQDLCRAGLLGRLRHDLSDSAKWDVHVHLQGDGTWTSGDVGLALLAGLLALALGRSIDAYTVFYGVRTSTSLLSSRHAGQDDRHV
jgi:hypothetical protein